MCKDCQYIGCAGCAPDLCKCNRSCYKCKLFNDWSSCHSSSISTTKFRNRFVCLTCNLCWKEKYDKYRKLMSCYKDDLHKYCQRFDKKIYFESEEIRPIGNCSKCRKCGKDAISVGDKFRPPKKSDTKSWNRCAEQKVMLFENYCPYDSKHTRSTHRYNDAGELDTLIRDYVAD